jgi:hypothetical protein
VKLGAQKIDLLLREACTDPWPLGKKCYAWSSIWFSALAALDMLSKKLSDTVPEWMSRSKPRSSPSSSSDRSPSRRSLHKGCSIYRFFAKMMLGVSSARIPPECHSVHT